MTLADDLRELADAVDAGALGPTLVERLARAVECPSLARLRRDAWIRRAAEHVPDVGELHALLVHGQWRWRLWRGRGDVPAHARPAEVCCFNAFMCAPLPQTSRMLRNILRRGNRWPGQFPPGFARVEHDDPRQQELDTWPAAT